MSDIRAAAQRIEQFLADEAVKAALQSMKEHSYILFLGADTDDKRREAQARAKAIDDFGAMMRATVEAGLLEKQREND